MGLFRQRPTLPPGRRVYAIGDVHGRFDLLGAMISEICTREGPIGSDGLTLLLLGDMIDRGPKSAQVVNLVRQCETLLPDVVALKGNHEEAMIAAWHGEPDALPAWLRFGGVDTLLSFGMDPTLLDCDEPDRIGDAMRRAIPAETIAWLDSRPLSYVCGDYAFVHAGIRPGLPLDRQDPADLLWIREEFLDYRASHGPVIVHGHTISDQVDFRRNRIGVDIGAYRTGRLAAVRLEGARRVRIVVG